MIRSMTGFGSATLAGKLGEFGVEVKSLNNRFLDISARLPRELSHLEMPLREAVRRVVGRGKVDVFVRWRPSAESVPAAAINADLLARYGAALAAVVGEAAAAGAAGALLGLPGVVGSSEQAGATDELAETVNAVVREALAALDSSRASEGRVMAADIAERLDTLRRARADVAESREALAADVAERLRARMAELAARTGAQLEPARVEFEVALLADKSDITEELVRLEAHLDAFAALCRPAVREPVGKKMDFLTQELLREVNTIGNKARGVAAAETVVAMKCEIEKIREQVQNIE